MAKTIDQLAADALGAAQLRILNLMAQCGQQQEEIEKLKAQIPTDTPAKGKK